MTQPSSAVGAIRCDTDTDAWGASRVSILATRQQLILLLGIPAVLLVGQLATGTNTVVAFLFTSAVLFGIGAVLAGGGFRSAFGCLNAILIGKLMVFGLVLKIMLGQSADGPLRSPLTTSLVMAVGFLALFMGTALQSRLYCPQRFSINKPISDGVLLCLSIVIFLSGYIGYFSAMIPSTHGEGIQTGGWLGIARAFGSLMSFSIVPPMLYFWRKKTRLWMTHPAILALLAWSSTVGILTTSKEEALAPLAFYVLVGFLRYGLCNIRLWLFAACCLAYYAVIVFPYSQYVRNIGGREGGFAQRTEIIKDTFWGIISDPNFRTATGERVGVPAYFSNSPALLPFNRFAMVGEADRLVDATQRQQAFTGWETIVWGFKLLTPSFLFPNKPIFEAANRLAHIVGDVSSSDTTTQVSYGVMANFYNAFSLTGVLIGTSVFFGGFYYWIRLFLGNPHLSGEPDTSVLWFVWLIASFQHDLAESSVSGLIASLSFPFVLGVLWGAAQLLASLRYRAVSA
jgi:hypothetical protein